MANGSLSAVLHYLRRLQRDPGGTADLADARLLERYTALGDEAAFAALVRRHGPMVWGVCTRLLHHTQDAEDAFQATFLVLVRKARSLRGPDRLPPWLYGVAYRTALKARAEAARRKAREATAVEQRAGNDATEAVWDDVRSVLDEEVNRLPVRYRTPFLLCYLEGMSNEEAARRLGCPKGTVCSRLSRAREVLRKRLSRRGVTLSGAALAGVLSEHAAPAAVPLALVEATVGLGASAGILSTQAAVLAEGVLHGMFLSKVKLAVVVVLALGIAGSGAGVLTRGPAAKQAQAAAPPRAKAAPPAAVTKKEEEPANEAPTDKPRERVSDVELSKALTMPVKFSGFDDPKTTLIEALDVLTKRYGVTFDVNERAFKFEQVNDVLKMEIAQPNPIPEMNTRLGTILKKILERVPASSGATFLVRKDRIEITTQQAVLIELGIKSENPVVFDGPVPPEGVLPPLVWEDFEEQPLKLALRSVSNDSGSNIVLDPRAGEKAQTAVTARLMNVPVETAVRILADMADLQVVRLDNVLYVTTPQNAARLQAKDNAPRGGPPKK